LLEDDFPETTDPWVQAAVARGFSDSFVTEVPPGQTVLLKVTVLQDAAQYPLWVVQKMLGNEVDVPEQRGEASGQISRVW
jgi:hypothetical protein